MHILGCFKDLYIYIYIYQVPTNNKMELLGLLEKTSHSMFSSVFMESGIKAINKLFFEVSKYNYADSIMQNFLISL